jgi:hypothetical protein
LLLILKLMYFLSENLSSLLNRFNSSPHIIYSVIQFFQCLLVLFLLLLCFFKLQDLVL